MNPRSRAVGGLGGLVLLAAAAALLWPASDASPPRLFPEPAKRGDEAARSTIERAPVTAGGTTASAPSLTRAEAEVALEAARADHTVALAEFEDAQDELADIEHELASVEQFVEDLKARGEDPTDHAFEGLERLNPVMERFDERLMRVEAAEARARETGRALDRAHEQLEALRRNGRAG